MIKNYENLLHFLHLMNEWKWDVKNRKFEKSGKSISTYTHRSGKAKKKYEVYKRKNLHNEITEI